MSKRTTLAAGGLATDPNPLITAAQGAMRRADDVIFKHPNVASLRPSFAETQAKETDQRPRAMHVFRGTPVVASVDGSTYNLETASDVLDADAEPPDESISPTQFVEARGNLYYTTAGGVRKVTSPSAASMPAGLLEMPSPAIATASGDGTAIEPESAVAYRACIVRRDANGLVARSAPSPWMVHTNPSVTDTKDADVVCALAADVVEGDTVEVYRSLAVPVANTPSDILFLAVAQAITSGDVTAGYATVRDVTYENELGAELYTNSTREGALKANYRPPSAVVLAHFASCTWYGNTTERHALALGIKRAVEAGVSVPSEGLSYATSADAVAASGASVVALDTLSGQIHVGMYFSDTLSPNVATAKVAAYTTVTAVTYPTPTTAEVTLSTPLLGAFVNDTAFLSDRVTVNATELFAPRDFDPRGGPGAAAEALAHAISLLVPDVIAYGFADAATAGTAGTVIIRGEEIGTSITVSTSAPDGAVVSLAADLSLTSEALTKPNRFYYSKPDEPEHVPLVNYVSIGREDAKIYAAARSRDALLVFKADGIFKITGSAPDGWRVDELDNVTRVFRGSCVAEMGGLVYAWTDRGAVAVSELGVQNLSARAISRELDEYAFNMNEEPATAGCYVVGWPTAGLVLFGVPDGEGSDSTAYVYCYSEHTGRWSRWVMDTLCAARDHQSAALFFAKAGAWALRENSIGANDDGTTGYDTLHAILTWTPSGTTIEVLIANAGTWVPEAGDWVSTYVGDDPEYREVTGVSDDGTTYTLTISSAFTGSASSLTAYETAKPVLEWQPATGPDAFATNLWREMQVAIEARGTGSAIVGDLRWTMGASTEKVAEPATLAATSTRHVPAKRRTTLRAGIPREVARGVECSAYLAGSNLFAPWHCLGVTLVYTPDGGDAERSTR